MGKTFTIFMTKTCPYKTIQNQPKTRRAFQGTKGGCGLGDGVWWWWGAGVGQKLGLRGS